MERLAAWAVPAVESFVPILTILGRGRAAAAVALVFLVVFSLALVRLALRDGVHVACGCFGRPSVDVRVALVRNAALSAVAVAAWSLAPADASFGLPGRGDALPALLGAGTAAVAAITAWRAASWLGRGRA